MTVLQRDITGKGSASGAKARLKILASKNEQPVDGVYEQTTDHGSSFITVKEAADILERPERWVQRQLQIGKMLGEKRLVNKTYKWYIDVADLEAFVMSGGCGSDTALLVLEADVMTHDQEIAASTSSSLQDQSAADEVVRSFADKFLQKIEEERARVKELTAALESKDREIKFLTDLHTDLERESQEQARVATELTAKVSLLRQENAALSDERRMLQARVAELSKPWWKSLFAVQ
jgi:hypothetical protein